MPAASGAELLQQKGLTATPRRVAVLDCLLLGSEPLSAAEILERLQGSRDMNKATLYRILDLLVEQELVLRHSAGERSFRYCALAAPVGHAEGVHCHFHCTRCGSMQCLECPSFSLERLQLAPEAPSQVDRVEIRLDGVCERCREG